MTNLPIPARQVLVPVEPTEEMLAASGMYLGGDDYEWTAKQVYRAMLAAAPSTPDTRSADVPAGMKPWAGGDSAPADWDGGDVLRRNGLVTTTMGPSGWQRPAPDGLDGYDIIAYTPKSQTADTDAMREAM